MANPSALKMADGPSTAADNIVLENPRHQIVRLGAEPTSESFNVDAVLFPDLHLYTGQPDMADTSVSPSNEAPVESDQLNSADSVECEGTTVSVEAPVDNDVAAEPSFEPPAAPTMEDSDDEDEAK